jgi:hypothetical protein
VAGRGLGGGRARGRRRPHPSWLRRRPPRGLGSKEAAFVLDPPEGGRSLAGERGWERVGRSSRQAGTRAGDGVVPLGRAVEADAAGSVWRGEETDGRGPWSD